MKASKLLLIQYILKSASCKFFKVISELSVKHNIIKTNTVSPAVKLIYELTTRMIDLLNKKTILCVFPNIHCSFHSDINIHLLYGIVTQSMYNSIHRQFTSSGPILGSMYIVINIDAKSNYALYVTKC